MSRRFYTSSICVLSLACCLAARSDLAAQDYSVLRISEVLADNRTIGPTDVGGGSPDMVEITNTGDEQLDLGFGGVDGKFLSIGLSDSTVLPEPLPPLEKGDPPRPIPVWTFRDNVRIDAGESIVIFCDGNLCQDSCEPHADFNISQDGSEPITLWGPEVDGERQVIDQVWLPPLRVDVSFSRQDFGPAPVPVQDTFDVFGFTPGDAASFGSCFSLPGSSCANGCGDYSRRFCRGRDNNAPENIEPRVNRRAHSTNAPEAMEPVTIQVEVRDDKEPTPGNITSVRVRYTVDGVAQDPVTLEYEADSGVLPDITDFDPLDPLSPKKPLDRFTVWSGVIPGQPAGSLIQFIYEVEDAEGLSSTRPRQEDICDFNVGPCDREFGGHPDCVLDPASTSCGNRNFDPETDPPSEVSFQSGVRYHSCDAWFSYTSGYTVRPELEGLVINEVVPSQTTVVQDPSSKADSPLCDVPNPPDYCCVTRGENPPGPGCGFDDFVELFNDSDSEIDLSNLWLSDSYFQPRGWRFPSNARLAPGGYAIVWLDGDGGRCPYTVENPSDDCVSLCESVALDPTSACRESGRTAQACADECIEANCFTPCFFDCPDPSDVAANRYHANFQLNASDDQLFLFDFDEDAQTYGLVHGVEFTAVPSDKSLSLCPSGNRNGSFTETDVTFRASNLNETSCPDVVDIQFRRADANSSGGTDLSDAVFTLNWLFLGGTPPTCNDAADANDSGGIDLSDAVYTLNWLFGGGAAPPAPGADCGVDPTEDSNPECHYPPCA